MIISSDNVNIKFLKNLKNKHFRKKNGYFIIEGIKLIEEALIQGISFHSVFYSPSIELSSHGHSLLSELLKISPSFLISNSLMNSLSDTTTPQGIMAVLKADNILEYYDNNTDFSDGIWLLAYEIQDPGNLGTIIRTADAAGVRGVFLSPGTVDVFNSKVLRATMGSIFHLKLFHLQDVLSFIYESEKKSVTFYSTHVSHGVIYSQIKYVFPSILIIGNEGHGLSDDIISSSHNIVNIPIYGHSESLNVSVAAGVILYEMARQKYDIVL